MEDLSTLPGHPQGPGYSWTSSEMAEVGAGLGFVCGGCQPVLALSVLTDTGLDFYL